MSETISEGIVNCLIVTNSPEANIQLTRIHEQIFARGFSISSMTVTVADVSQVIRR